MNFIRKHWAKLFYVLTLIIYLTVIKPSNSRINLLREFEWDLIKQYDGTIDEIDQKKYCDLLIELSEKNTSNCQYLLSEWKSGLTNKRIETLDKIEDLSEAIDRKINLFELICLFMPLTALIGSSFTKPNKKQPET
ncbi:MAG: hypothetical protein ACJA1C_003050 [Crocinitomicaceae bacterium]|jgi:hypothetical protein